MRIHDVHEGITGHRKTKRYGRGPGSGHGKTAGRGHKGQGSRSGSSRQPVFQGGAMPLVRRVPKRGFHNRFALTVIAVNVSDLEQAFQAGEAVTPETLRERRLIRSRFDAVKILGDGQLTKKLNVSAHRFSQSAREKISAAGGEIIELAVKIPVADKQKAKQAAKSSKPSKSSK